MRPEGYEYQSDFAKKYYSEGKAEGEAEGRAETLIKLLTLKLDQPIPQAVEAKIKGASLAELEQWLERVLSANTLDDIFQEK